MNPAKMAEIRERLQAALKSRLATVTADPDTVREVLVCAGGACISSRSLAVVDALRNEIESAGIASRARIVQVGCMGLCGEGPLVLISPDGIYYGSVDEDGARRIVREHLAGGRPVKEMEVTWEVEDGRILRSREVPFFASQMKIALRNCGVIDPASIDEYIAMDGYRALEKVLFELPPKEVLDTLRKSDLRGRGGAGFPVGLKWQFVQESRGNEKFIVCNADEGDPGAFMDRSILEGDPHSVIEGMAIAGRVIGARQGYIYVRAEYPLAIERLRIAFEQARSVGLLGDRILGSDFRFDIDIRIGAGAFVCGEETALMHSIEGKRGMPRPRPPFPAQEGLWGKPTLLNNVESWANTPPIILKGSDWFSSIGTGMSKGTKVFALAGAVRNTGLVEVPMGTSLRAVVDEIGGGVPSGLALKAAQSGGPSGGCVPAAAADVPIDYESLQELGAIMGSGGLIVLDQSTCMVELSRFFLEFLVDESCGKCPPCRIGTRVMLNILEAITSGRGTMEDLKTLEDLGRHIQTSSLCGLGQTAPNAVLSTLRHFRQEYVEHIEEGRCRACACKEMVPSPCQHACPAGINVPRYVREAAAGNYKNSYLVVRERIPLPGICGLVCFAPCEPLCRRGQLDESISISIRALKRAASEFGSYAEPSDWERPETSGKKVAIVGSGPAGLTAGYYLSRKGGHQVTVFESLPEPGGMLRYGIPRYRLPAEDLDREIREIIEAAGVEIRTSTTVGSADDLKREGYDAVFLAIGAHDPLRMKVEGEEEEGVLDGVELLRRVGGGNPPELGSRVAVVGGGNTAVDAARTALRLGASEVTILYRRTREEMPADPEEIEAALDEDIRLRYLTLPSTIRRQGGELAVECLQMRLGTADSSGRRRPEPVEGSEFTLRLDNVVTAIGQKPAGAGGFDIELGWGERAVVDRKTLATDREGVYAGGDFVLGPASVIEAVAHGRRAAQAIDLYLGGTGEIEETFTEPEDLSALPPLDEDESAARVHTPRATPDSRKDGFLQVEEGFSRDQACLEAKRCLRCDLEVH